MSVDTKDCPFESYLDYVKALAVDQPQYRELRSGLELSKSNQLGRIQLQDVRTDGSYTDTRSFAYNEANVVKKLKNALSDRPPDVRTRVILIEYRLSPRFDPFYGAEEAIPLSNGLWCEVGLKLDIEPLFFEASWNKGRILRQRQYPHKPHDFLRMIYMTLKFIRGPDFSYAVVAFNSARKMEGNPILYMTSPSPSVQQFKSRDRPKSGSRIIETVEFDDQERPSGKDAGDVFLGLLRAERTDSSEDDLFRCLSVTTRIENLFFRASLGKFFLLWEKMTVEPSEQMAIRFRATWRPCRRRLDNFKESVRAFTLFAKRHFDQPEYKKRLEEVYDEQDDAVHEGDAIESILRDDMRHSVGNVQVEVAKAVLAESRRSIEEGKRVQLITILAFVFIPLSLAASLFGMNVHQINGTGPSIWTFVLTSVVLVLLALGGWLVSHIILKRKRKSDKLN